MGASRGASREKKIAKGLSFHIYHVDLCPPFAGAAGTKPLANVDPLIYVGGEFCSRNITCLQPSMLLKISLQADNMLLQEHMSNL